MPDDALALWECVVRKTSRLSFIAGVSIEDINAEHGKDWSHEQFLESAVELQNGGIAYLSQADGNFSVHATTDALTQYAEFRKNQDRVWGCKCGAGFTSKEAYDAHRNECDASKGSGNFFG